MKSEPDRGGAIESERGKKHEWEKRAHNQRLRIPRHVHTSFHSLIRFIKFTEINGLQFILKRDKKNSSDDVHLEQMRWCRAQPTTATQPKTATTENEKKYIIALSPKWATNFVTRLLSATAIPIHTHTETQSRAHNTNTSIFIPNRVAII